MKKILSSILVFLIGVFVFSIFNQIDDMDYITRSYDDKMLKTDALAYLNDYHDVELSINDKDSTFYGTKDVKLLNNVELLSTESVNLDGLFVSFEATFVSDLNIYYIKTKLNRDLEVLDQINLIGYPFFNNSLNRVDISFEFFGHKFLASDLMDEVFEKQAISGGFFLELDAGGGTGGSTTVDVTTPILQISISIINAGDTLVEDSINSLQDIVPVDFWEDGPLHYLLWYVKAEKAFDNYNHNKGQTIPTNALLTDTKYIDHQYLLSNWQFGFQSLNNNGCGIISLYNLLISQNRTPDLPSLILLNELMNTDLGLGFLGVSPIDNDLMIILSNTVNAVFQLMQPVLHLVSPVIAAVITTQLIESELEASTKWWQDMLIWASLPINYAITLVAVNAAIVAAVAVVDLVTDFYLEHLHGLPDVLEVLGYESLDVTYLSYDDFNSGRLEFGYFILTTFNGLPDFTDFNTLPAHTYFVKRDYVNQTSLTAYNNQTQSTTNFYSLFATYANRNDQFISGITIKG